MNTMKGKQFGDVEIIELNMSQQLLAVLRLEYENCFQQWKRTWNKSIQAEGAYCKRNQPIMEVNLVWLVSQHECSYFLIRLHMFGYKQ
jgi:hypothetical protein